MGKGGSETTTQQSTPWGAAVPGMKRSIRAARQIYNDGGFAPTVDPSRQTNMAERGIMRTSQHTPYLNQIGYDDVSAAQMAGPDAISAGQVSAPGTGGYDRISTPDAYNDLATVKANAIGGVLPQVMSQFAGSGMADSSLAVDTAARAATEAAAPYDYNAYTMAQTRDMQAQQANQSAGMMDSQFNAGQNMQGQLANQAANLSAAGANQNMDYATQSANMAAENAARQSNQNAALQFSSMAPSFEAARYLPSQMQAQVGAARDARAYDAAAAPLNNLMGYGNFVSSMGGQGGMSSMTQPGQSGFGAAAGGALQGAAAGAPLGPWGMAAGAGLGLLSSF